jgi:nitroreductase
MIASVHGPVRPRWEHGSSVVASVAPAAPAAPAPAASSATTSACLLPGGSVAPVTISSLAVWIAAPTHGFGADRVRAAGAASNASIISASSEVSVATAGDRSGEKFDDASAGPADRGFPPAVVILPGMDVTEAVNKRKSVRAFLPDPVDDGTIRELLTAASRAPSGGNVQPWRIYVVNGDSMARFREFLQGREIETPTYDIYPKGLTEPYRTSRFELGEAMYATIGIPRDDKPARLAQVAKNYDFFGAPAAIFCFIEEQMGPPQWSDLGMFLQTFMLLAQEAGLDTCPQESWAVYGNAVKEFVGAPPEQGIFCGVAIGHADWDHPINALESERVGLDVFTTFV